MQKKTQYISKKYNFITNKNFRNNQNYILSEYIKYDFHHKYYNYLKKYILIFSWIAALTPITLYITGFLNILKFENAIFLWLIWFIFTVYLLTTINEIWYMLKKYYIIFFNKKFNYNSYLFKKNPKKFYSRKDFIYFKRYKKNKAN